MSFIFRQIHLLIVFSILGMNGCSIQKREDMTTVIKPGELHAQILTLDSHVDTPLRIMHDDVHLAQRHDPETDNSRLDFPRMREGGLDGVFFAVWTGQRERSPKANQVEFEKADHILDVIYDEIGENSDQAAIASHSTDLARLAKAGKFAIYLGIENGYAIGDNLDKLDYFY